MMNTEQLCNHIIHMIHMPIHVYDEDGRQTAVYVDHGEQQDILDCDNDFLQTLLVRGQRDYPVFYLEARQVIYGIVKAERQTYVVGPCCISRAETEMSHYLVREHRMDSKKPYKVFYTSLDMFSEVIIMLYEMAAGRSILKEELLRKNFCDEKLLHSMQKKLHKTFYELRESNFVHNPYSQELREQEAIRTGDIEALTRSFEESFIGRYGILSHEPLRQMKNMNIVVITLACRSAIAGGLLPEIAFSMSDAFIQHSEGMKDVAEAWVFGRQAEIEYCRAVQELTVRNGQNPLVMQCKDLIVKKLHSKLTVKEIADQLGITPGYLSHLFLREEQMKLAEYIVREKIDATKKELVYTEKSLDEVAYSFGFVSQSHFGQAFKKWSGMTPGQYRENYRIEQRK